MKTSSVKKFTLIELLVVIAIITILAGMVFPAIGLVRNSAKKSKAQSECQSLKTAILAYETEFSCWPAKCGSGDSMTTVSSNKSEYAKMCNRLMGENTKKTIFYEGGVNYDDQVGFLDPWGRPYQIYFDVDFDGKIDNGTVRQAAGLDNGKFLHNRVAVFSFGVDLKDKDKDSVDKLRTRSKLATSW